MREAILSFFVIIFLSGCAKLAHMQELLTLKAMSDDGERQKRYVKAQDDKFAALLEKVKSQQIKTYPDQRSILKAFGDPIMTKAVEKDGQVLEQWLYRYSVKFFDSEKVYLFFDNKGQLIQWEYVEAPRKEKSDG